MNKQLKRLLLEVAPADAALIQRELRKAELQFARSNPTPVLEFAADGSLSYFNDAASALARSLQQEHPHAILPGDAAALVKICLATGQNRVGVQTSVQGRTIAWSFFPQADNQVVHCYAEDITEKLNAELQLRQVQKMDSIGQLTAGVAHDFNNILTVIQGHAGLLLSDKALDSLLADSARQISIAAQRASNLTRQLLMFSRKERMQPQLLDLTEIIANLSKMLRSLVGEQVTVRRNSGQALPAIHADPGMLEQVLVNLAANARDAMPEGGQLTVSTCAREIDEAYVRQRPEARKGFFVCLSVADTGQGMDAATLGRIFEPFFTTKAIGEGTGLGLATVHGIVKQHQGWVEVESRVGQGTTFKIFLPASSKARSTREANHQQTAPGGHETILVVEDEASLRELVRELLRKKGYTVLEAATGVQALKLWQEHKSGIDLLFTDMMMPEGVSGRDLAEKVLAEKPSLKVIYSSGYSLDAISPGFRVTEGSNYLQKPYHPDALARMVRSRLDSAAP